jgi:hypothetical protein
MSFNSLGAVNTLMSLVFATLVCGCGYVDTHDKHGPPLFTIFGKVFEGNSEISIENPRVAFIWDKPSSESDLAHPGAVRVAQDVPITPNFPSKFTIDIFEPPPIEAMEPGEDLDEELAGLTLARGKLVVYDDRNQNGKLDLLPKDAEEWVDYILGPEEEYLVWYVEGLTSDSIIYDPPLAPECLLIPGYNLFEHIGAGCSSIMMMYGRYEQHNPEDELPVTLVDNFEMQKLMCRDVIRFDPDAPPEYECETQCDLSNIPEDARCIEDTDMSKFTLIFPGEVTCTRSSSLPPCADIMHTSRLIRECRYSTTGIPPDEWHCEGEEDPPPPSKEELWHFSFLSEGISSECDGALAIGPNGTVFVTFRSDKHVFAINPDGSLRWKLDTGGDGLDVPVVGDDGTVYVSDYLGIISDDHGSPDQECHLYSIAAEGTLNWSLSTGYTSGKPTIGTNNTIFFISSEAPWITWPPWDDNWESITHQLNAVSTDGTILWQVETRAPIMTWPVLDGNNNMYVGLRNGDLLSFYPEGNLNWSQALGCPIVSSPIVGNGKIYFLSYDKFSYAYSIDGEQLWRRETVSEAYGGWPAAIAQDDSILIFNPEWMLEILEPEGTFRNRYKSSSPMKSTPVILDNGSVLLGARGGVFAMNTDGSLDWIFDTHDEIFDTHNVVATQINVGPDGTIYLLPTTGILYAIEGDSPMADSPWPTYRGNSRNSGRK